MFVLKTSTTEVLASGFIPMPKQGCFFPLSLKIKIQMNRNSGYDVAKMLYLESTPLGDLPPLRLTVQGLG